jgi:succinate dehydrogenase flavin-adding protein (antitoxin of CptAB toxin-antitoxin module)
MVELYVRGQEIKDEDLPDGKRKWVTGSGRTPEEAEKRLLTALQKRGYRKGLGTAGTLPKRSEGGMRTEDFLLRWHSELSNKSLSTTQILKYKQHLYNHVIPL